MDIINDGNIMSFDEDESCALELGRTFHDDEDGYAVADVPSVGNVLISDTQYQAYRQCAKLLRFMDDPSARVTVRQNFERFGCFFTDPFTGQPGCEYGDTPSEALAAALNVVRFRRTQRERAA